MHQRRAAVKRRAWRDQHPRPDRSMLVLQHDAAVTAGHSAWNHFPRMPAAPQFFQALR
jgi:hypothetical protein